MNEYKNKYKKIIAQLLLSVFLFENCTQLNNLAVAPAGTKPAQEEHLSQDKSDQLISKEDNVWEVEEMSNVKSTRELSSIDLASFTSTQGFRIDGAAANDQAGRAVSGLRDVNGDGVNDIGVTAQYADPFGRNYAGVSYIIYGKPANTRPNVDLTTLTPTDGFQIYGAVATDQLGQSINDLGDFNGDGTNDFMVTAHSASPLGRNNAGAGYLIYGKQGATRPNIDLASLDTKDGFMIYGAASDDYFGYSSATADINGDGVPDAVISAPEANPLGRNGAGSTYVIYGKKADTRSNIDLANLLPPDGFIIYGANGEVSGDQVSGIGDINKDGIDDIIITTRIVDKSYVIYGKPLKSRPNLDLASFTPADGFIISGNANLMPTYANNAKDIDGDGVNDFIIGRIGASPFGKIGAGTAHVIYGQPGSTRPNIDLANLSKCDGFSIYGAAAEDQLGKSVAGIGDFNGDGRNDTAIGAAYQNPYNRDNAGAGYILFGKKACAQQDIDLANLSPSDGFVINGATAIDWTGWSLSSLGDINKDGVTDMIINAPGADPSSKNQAGSSYVIYGINQPPVLTQNSLSISQGQTLALSTTNLAATDVDNSANQLIFKVDSLQGGFFSRWGKPTQPIVTFSQADIQGGFIQFTSNSTVTPSYTVSVSDVTHNTYAAAAQVTFQLANPARRKQNELSATSSASRVEATWYSPAKWLNAVRSYFQGAQPAMDTPKIDTSAVEGLMKLQHKCERMIREADAKTADKWYRFSLEDLQEEMAVVLAQPEQIMEETIKEFSARLEGVNKDFLTKPLLKKPSFFAGIQDRVEVSGLGINHESSLLQPAVTPMLGAGYVVAAIGK